MSDELEPQNIEKTKKRGGRKTALIVGASLLIAASAGLLIHRFVNRKPAEAPAAPAAVPAPPTPPAPLAPPAPPAVPAATPAAVSNPAASQVPAKSDAVVPAPVAAAPHLTAEEEILAAKPLSDACSTDAGVLCYGQPESRLSACLGESHGSLLPGCKAALDAREKKRGPVEKRP